MSCLLYDPDALPSEKGTLQYPLNRRLVGPQSQSECFGEEKNLAPSGYQSQDLFSPFPSHCTDYVVTTYQSACSTICAAHVFERRQHMVETAENGDCSITCTCFSRDMFLENFRGEIFHWEFIYSKWIIRNCILLACVNTVMFNTAEINGMACRIKYILHVVIR